MHQQNCRRQWFLLTLITFWLYELIQPMCAICSTLYCSHLSCGVLTGLLHVPRMLLVLWIAVKLKIRKSLIFRHTLWIQLKAVESQGTDSTNQSTLQNVSQGLLEKWSRLPTRYQTFTQSNSLRCLHRIKSRDLEPSLTSLALLFQTVVSKPKILTFEVFCLQ